MNREEIQTGAIYYVGADCGVPHGFRPIRFRVIAVDPSTCWQGMAFLDGYELGDDGQAVERRRIYVIVAGLRLLPIRPAVPAAPPQRRRPTNAGPVQIPRPRIAPDITTPGRTR